MGAQEEDRIRLSDIADSIMEIEAYVGQGEFGDFSISDDVKAAIVGHLSQVGGAAALLSDEFKENYRDIDWDVLAGLQYANYDQEMELDMMPHWHIIASDLPEIKDQILDIMLEMDRTISSGDEIAGYTTGTEDADSIRAVEGDAARDETFLNSRFEEGDLVGDLESESQIIKDQRDSHFPSEELEDLTDMGLRELSSDEKKMLNDINAEVTSELDMESLDNMDINSIDIADDSFIDQRYEDVDLMEGSSLDEDGYGGEERERERGE